jgi:hypothetical protein
VTYIGIDPGKSGAMAVIEEGIAFAIPFDERKYIDTLMTCDPKQTVACLEHVHSMPGQGVASSFKFGENFGWIQGVLNALDIPYELVTPRKWKKEFSATSDKNTSIDVCKRLFPAVSLKKTELCTKDSDGLAEALLMAEYARRKFRSE